MSDLLNPRQAAQRLRVSRETVLQLARKGEIPHIRLPGGFVRFEEGDLIAWVERHRFPGGQSNEEMV